MSKYRQLAPTTLDWIVSHRDAGDLLWYLARNRLPSVPGSIGFRWVTI